MPAFFLSELARRGVKPLPEGEQVIIAQVMARYGSTLQGRERFATMVPGNYMLIFADKEPYTGEADRVVVVDCDEAEEPYRPVLKCSFGWTRTCPSKSY